MDFQSRASEKLLQTVVSEVTQQKWEFPQAYRIHNIGIKQEQSADELSQVNINWLP